jgi:hypothetical protein
MSRNTLHSRQAEYEKTIWNPTTRKQYAYILDRLVLFLGKDKAPEDVFRSEMPALRQHLREVYAIKTPMSMAMYMRVGRSFYNWMDIMEYVPIGFNPFRSWVRNMERAAEPLEFEKV